jgi:hypothetical protein
MGKKIVISNYEQLKAWCIRKLTEAYNIILLQDVASDIELAVNKYYLSKDRVIEVDE